MRYNSTFETIYDLLGLLGLMLLSGATVVYIILLILRWCGVVK
jgi:hypothetical protein